MITFICYCCRFYICPTNIVLYFKCLSIEYLSTFSVSNFYAPEELIPWLIIEKICDFCNFGCWKLNFCIHFVVVIVLPYFRPYFNICLSKAHFRSSTHSSVWCLRHCVLACW